MEQIPDFWRTEVFHPLSVHFPIALLSVAWIFKIISLRYRREVWDFGGTVLLILGVAGLWLAIFTGNLADGIVSRKLCDPTVLKEHENLAWLAGWIFSGGLIVDLIRIIDFPLFKKTFLLALVVLTLSGGTGVLLYTGHLGASLVYQQAAGVNVPSGNCAEFE